MQGRYPHLIPTLCLSLTIVLAAPPAVQAQRAVVAPGVVRLGTIQDDTVDESSGLAASRRYANVFWTHNDDGGVPRLFAITRGGRRLAVYRVVGATVKDWEDIAIDATGALYLADIGNNDGNRKTVRVHRLEEPNPNRSGKVAVEHTWKIKYPGKPFDAESFFVSQGFGYLITKQRKHGKVTVYRFPLTTGSSSVRLARVTRIKLKAPATAACLSHDERKLAR